jgi:orotidine-5'-phosphate decarboxylase
MTVERSSNGGTLGRRSRSRSTSLAGEARPFGDILAARVQERESQIVLGLDPDPSMLWPRASKSGGSGLIGVGEDEHATPAERIIFPVVHHCAMVIDAVAEACVAVKLQLACFERLGSVGWTALDELVAYARSRWGLLVILDGKRGDIDISARAYAQALFGGVETSYGHVRGLEADLATVNPLMGRDAVAPFVTAARECSAGVLALVRTSNPGAADVEDLQVAGGGTVWERLAAIVDELGRPGVGESGLSDVGAVVGATVPGHLARARELMPNAVFLLPGVGAQGGRVDDLAPAFAPGRAGALITASRSIVNAHQATGGDPAGAARAEAERLRDAAWALRG